VKLFKGLGILAVVVGTLIGARAALTHSVIEAGVALLLTLSGVFMAVGESPPFM